ncbi:PHD finger protein 24-like isoform X2 [Lineus longissimus]|uniref:PHD finger protein 24-like isoform X2 n=1 Tax=Lineus longissimus TaxID=88925 RepID=UPI00315DDD3D
MGAGASRNIFRQKAQMVGILQASRPSHQAKDYRPEDDHGTLNGSTPVEAKKTLEMSFTDTAKAWEELRAGSTPQPGQGLTKTTLTIEDFKKIKRQKTVDIDENDTFDIPYQQQDKVQSDKLCHVCSVYTGSETYPCRICTRVYHESCLRTIGHCQDTVSTAQLLRAKEIVGWSCPNCDTLNNLLTEEEMEELMDTFDKLDLNRDTSVSLEEFLTFKKRQYLEEVCEEIDSDTLENMKREFRIMDADRTGTLDWWEFLNYESVKMLEKRSKVALVRLLSPKEVERIRETFTAFDTDCDGEITTSEATKAYYKCDPAAKGNMDIARMVIQSVKNLMTTADGEACGTISWEDYVYDQVLYVLAARPNDSNLHTKAMEKLELTSVYLKPESDSASSKSDEVP